jgi:hypothetical protein
MKIKFHYKPNRWFVSAAITHQIPPQKNIKQQLRTRFRHNNQLRTIFHPKISISHCINFKT